jgi:hypothetical protein
MATTKGRVVPLEEELELLEEELELLLLEVEELLDEEELELEDEELLLEDELLDELEDAGPPPQPVSAIDARVAKSQPNG